MSTMTGTEAVLITTVVLISTLRDGLCFSINGSSAIHRALFADYNNLVRPFEKVTIDVEFALLSINELDLKKQKLSTSGFFTVLWSDNRLTWTPTDYDNITYIYTTELNIWRPELVVDNSITKIEVIEDDDLLFRVKYDGNVKWEPPGIYDTHCEVDITWFPFDRQTCYVELTSWAYNSNIVNLSHHKPHMDLVDYQQNGEWYIVSSSIGWRQLIADDETFSQLDFFVTVDRRPIYYFMNTIFPVILISFLSTIVYILPVESGERISFSITVLLALALLLTLISDIMPTTSIHTSVLAVYIMVTLTLSTLSVLLATLNLRLYHKSNQDEIPKWLQTFTKTVILTWLCRRKCHKTRKKPVIKEENIEDPKDPDKKTVATAWEENEPQDEYKEYEDFEMTAKNVSILLDQYLFRTFVLLTVTCTFFFLLIVGIGAKI